MSLYNAPPMKHILFVISILVLVGCSGASSNPLSKDHPGFGFYEVASRGTVSSANCLKLEGSIAIPAAWASEGRYELVSEKAPGLFQIRDKENDTQHVLIAFMEWSGFIAVPKTCSWEASEGDWK